MKRFSTEVKYHQPNAHGRNLVLSVLNSTVTKREAKDYLNKYTNENNLNYCIVLLRNMSEYSESLLLNFIKTVSKIQTLGLRPILVLDPLCSNLSHHSQKLDDLLHDQNMKSIIISDPITLNSDNTVEVNLPIISPHIIPIIQPYNFYETEAVKKVTTDPAAFITTLIKSLPIKVDKLFIIGKYGGLPSNERQDNSHVFVNLSQEYEDLKRNYTTQSKNIKLIQSDTSDKDLVEALQLYLNKNKMLNDNDQLKCHIEDLEIMNQALSVLPSSSTGLITTFPAASNLSDSNPLVYNILTDRSLISSSLPRFKRSRINKASSWYELPTTSEELIHASNDSVLVTTVVKKGIDIHIFDYRTLSQENCEGLPPSHDKSSTTIPKANKKLDLKKLKLIIDSSFKKSIDLTHYLNRINGQIASIIVIGDYEGIAILTYEGPPENQFVYLDKFAVMPHLKGSLGISDIIFNLMFRKFPQELIWRSRADNVVNKWYFQRSTGVLDLSLKLGPNDQKDSIFKLFYYGDPEIESFHDINRLRDYAKYVRDISPSWLTK